jgi:hypothetical protein
MHDLDFDNQDPNPDAGVMDEAAASIRRELRSLGFAGPAGAG